VILADQVKNLDWRVRQAEFICKLPRETTSEVLEKIGRAFIRRELAAFVPRAKIFHRNADGFFPHQRRPRIDPQHPPPASGIGGVTVILKASQHAVIDNRLCVKADCR
jgi:hypothetical protein